MNGGTAWAALVYGIAAGKSLAAFKSWSTFRCTTVIQSSQQRQGMTTRDRPREWNPSIPFVRPDTQFGRAGRKPCDAKPVGLIG